MIVIGATRAPDSAATIVAEIQRADYEGDRAALKHLYQDLSSFVDEHSRGAKVRYWRGFALWRRALNGFNESADQRELEEDLTLAVSEFEQVDALAPDVDAKVGAAACLQNLAYIYLMRRDTTRARDLLQQSFPLLSQAETMDPDNPRLLWVLGASRWYAPPARGGGQTAAIETYEKGLRSARARAAQTSDALTPSWGEPELLMNLAFANLHRTTPDLVAAERYARSALALVPYWHYVRDTLLPQIRDAARAHN
jgi:tetratricopeptide (TPR) repeat protein